MASSTKVVTTNLDLPRQSSVCSLSSLLAEPSKSITMDDLLHKSMYSEPKTMEDVWKEMVTGTTTEPQQQNNNNNEMTLEDFLSNSKALPVTDHDVSTIIPSAPNGTGVSQPQPQGGRGKRRRAMAAAVEDAVVDKATLQKQRRMIKNRESAARSRERKQAYTVELESMVVHLEEEHARLLREEADRNKQRYKQAEQRAREESERLRKEEREQIAEKRRRDLTLRARVTAKTEEKRLELLFLRWSEHHKRLSNFIRTKAEPPIYYFPNKPLEEDAESIEKRKEEAFLEWKNARREEVSEYQKEIGEQYLANVEKELERWQNARNARKVNNDQNLQETMDKELDTHRLEHGPKKRKIPGGGSNNEDDDDVEDINVGEDDMMDDELDDDSGRRVEETTTKAEEADNNNSADPAADANNVDGK